MADCTNMPSIHNIEAGREQAFNNTVGGGGRILSLYSLQASRLGLGHISQILGHFQLKTMHKWDFLRVK